MKYPRRAGLFGIGLDAYGPQFRGLKERLLKVEAGQYVFDAAL